MVLIGAEVQKESHDLHLLTGLDPGLVARGRKRKRREIKMERRRRRRGRCQGHGHFPHPLCSMKGLLFTLAMTSLHAGLNNSVFLCSKSHFVLQNFSCPWIWLWSSADFLVVGTTCVSWVIICLVVLNFVNSVLPSSLFSVHFISFSSSFTCFFQFYFNFLFCFCFFLSFVLSFTVLSFSLWDHGKGLQGTNFPSKAF